MAFQRGSTSFDTIPAFLERSRSVKIEKTASLNAQKSNLTSPDHPFDAGRRMYDEESIEVIRMAGSARLPATTPWISRGNPIIQRSMPLATMSTGRAGIKEQLQKKMAERSEKPPAKRVQRRRAAPCKRRRTSSEDEDGISLDEESEELSEEEDEATSSDERFINEETESNYSDEDEDGTGSSEDDAEFSDDDEEDEEDELALSGVEDDSDEEEDYVAAERAERKEHENVAHTASIMQINRRLTPILTMVDTRLFNIIVCMFWAVKTPIRRNTTPLCEAIPSALHCIMNNTFFVESDESVGACFVWLVNHAKLRSNLFDNYSSPALEHWLEAIQRLDTLDDTPVFVYLREKTQTCFLSGQPCRTGVQLLDVTTKEPMSTLWFDASNEKTNAWVLNLTRFLFLPATLAQYCSLELSSDTEKLSDTELKKTYDWIQALNDDLAVFLFQEGVTPGITAALEKNASRNYVN